MAVTQKQLKIEFDRTKAELRAYLAARLPAGMKPVVSVDDLLQEIWLTANRSIETVRQPEAVSYWLRKVAERKLIDTLRHARCRKRGGDRVKLEAADSRTSYLNLFWSVAQAQRSPSSVDAVREATDAVKAALAELPDDYRKAVTLHHIDGLTHEEIGKAMSRSPSAVNSLLHRGMVMLRSVLGSPGRFFSHG